MQHFKMMMRQVLRKNTIKKQIVSIRKYSIPTVNVTLNQDVCMCDSDPLSQTQEDRLKMYELPDKYYNLLTPALPKGFLDLCNTIQRKTLLIREHVLEVRDILEDSQVQEVRKILMHGRDGGGKSLTMLHVLHCALLKKMVIIYIPNAYDFVNSGKWVPQQALQQATFKTDRIDQPEKASEWLNIFRNLNTDFLLENNTTGDYQWGKRDVTNKGQPLMDVVQQGISRSSFASDCVGVLLKEIRLKPHIDVLYAVDGVNGLFQRTNCKVNKRFVQIETMSLVHHFTKLFKPEFMLKKGAYVMATTRSQEILFPTDHLKDKHLLSNLFDYSALCHLSEFTQIEVPYYNEQEFLTMLRFYKETDWLARDLTHRLAKEINFLTTRQPDMVRQMLAPM